MIAAPHLTHLARFLVLRVTKGSVREKNGIPSAVHLDADSSFVSGSDELVRHGDIPDCRFPQPLAQLRQV